MTFHCSKTFFLSYKTNFIQDLRTEGKRFSASPLGTEGQRPLDFAEIVTFIIETNLSKPQSKKNRKSQSAVFIWLSLCTKRRRKGYLTQVSPGVSELEKGFSGPVHSISDSYRSFLIFVSDKPSVHTTPKLSGMRRSDYSHENHSGVVLV